MQEALLNPNPIEQTVAKKHKDKILLEWSNINYKITVPPSKKSKVAVASVAAAEVADNKIISEEQTSRKNTEENVNINNPTELNDPTKKIILKNIEGFALPNELLAIMGPSGSGKTTLLNVIASRQLPREKTHKITREVKANNILMDDSNFGKICAYVMQDDILLGCLTPRESLYFGARLKLRTTEENIKIRVERLIFQFGLEKCANSRIGTATSKGISGGERKRTSIAYEIISNPPVVIIDEPTTGMDSFTSLVIIKYLKQLANTGKTIICTIHQPSSEIFNYINRLILLKDGHLVYQGKAEWSLKYFEAIGCTIPAFCNPFDFFLDVLSDSNSTHKQLNESYNRLCEEEVRDEHIKLHEEYKSKDILTIKENIRQVDWCKELWLLFKRTMTSYVRDSTILFTRIIGVLLNSLIIMGFYWNIGSEEKQDQLFQNYVGFFFNNVNTFFVNGIFASLFGIPNLKIVLKREYSAKLYRISSFYVSFAFSLIFNSLIATLLYTPITYFSIRLFMSDIDSNLTCFFVFFVINFFMYTLGQYFGLLIGGTFKDSLTFIISPFVFIIFMLGAGMYRGNDSLPVYIRWFFYISPYKYMLELAMKNFSNFNDMTKIIPETMGYNFGDEVTIPTLLGMMTAVLILGYLGLKNFTAKF